MAAIRRYLTQRSSKALGFITTKEGCCWEVLVEVGDVEALVEIVGRTWPHALQCPWAQAEIRRCVVMMDIFPN